MSSPLIPFSEADSSIVLMWTQRLGEGRLEAVPNVVTGSRFYCQEANEGSCGPKGLNVGTMVWRQGDCEHPESEDIMMCVCAFLSLDSHKVKVLQVLKLGQP